MDLQSKKELILKYEWILSRIFRIFGRNKISVKKRNKVFLGNAFMKRCNILVCGHNNYVKIEPGLTRLNNTSITIYGNNCSIYIGAGCNLNNCELYIEDNNGMIHLKRHITITGHTEIAVIEGTKVTVGEDCLFSSQITIRTGDSHSILDQSSGCRINLSKDIIIGDHVWIGNDVKILKGVTIDNHSIVATGAILTESNYPSHCIIGGIGNGRVLKTGIDWCPQRI